MVFFLRKNCSKRSAKLKYMQRAYPKKGGHQKSADFAKINIVEQQKIWTDMAAYNMRNDSSNDSNDTSWKRQ